MSIHISAKEGEIAPVVLLAGDPLRAKHMATSFLDKPVPVNTTRGMLFYTGTYKGTKLTIGASGMGIPSIGIYSYELYNEYNVGCIMRIGTCGAYLTEIDLFELINAESAYSESTYAKSAFGFNEDHFDHQGVAYDIINLKAKELKMIVRTGAIHSGDAFYRTDPVLPKIATQNNCLAAEMEAFALFANAKHFKKMAATLLTVSDIIPDKRMISAEERERHLEEMFKLSLESAVEIERSLKSIL